MAEFIYFRNQCSMWYPTGENFSHAFDYIEEAAFSIDDVFPTGRFILVVRGHSGSILAGGIAYLLRRKDRDVQISISRKSESTHGDNLEGIYPFYETDEVHIIVVDDFIQTGETINAILKDLAKVMMGRKTFDMLCIANHWDESSFTKEGGDEYWKAHKEVASHFEYILCNPKIRKKKK